MADSARDIAHNPAAPAAERFDAQAELAKSVRDPASAIPANELAPMLEGIRREFLLSEPLRKAQVIPFPGRNTPPPKRGMQSLYLDGWQVQAAGPYYERPSALPFEALRSMVKQTPILSSVVLTRIRQVGRFCGISDDGGPGFEICHMDRSHKKTDAETRACKDLAKFFLNCGWEWRPRERRRLRRTNFSAFMAKSVADSLSMDSAPIETEMKRDRSRGIDGFYAPDGATIRLCTEEGYEGDDSIYALQVVQGSISAAYSLDDLIYEPRNATSDVASGGYGLGEPELLVRTVTGFLNAMTYNIAGFDKNQIPKGMLHLHGKFNDDDLVAFKRYWNAMASGVENAWALPIMVSKDQESAAKFEKFGVEYNEMYFAKWMSFLTSLICAIYGMSPDEINFESFASSKSSLSGSDTTEKLADSKDKGLRPLLAYYENIFTDYVVHDFSPDLCFRWVGLDPKDPQQEAKEREATLTVDEMRALRGDQPHPIPEVGAAPLNPSLMGVYMQTLQKEAPDFGTVEEGAEGGKDFGGAEGGGDFGQGEEGKDEEQGLGADDEGGDEEEAFGKALRTIFEIGA